MAVEHDEDAELDAECRVLGSMMRGEWLRTWQWEPLPAEIAFTDSFHAALFMAMLVCRQCERKPTPNVLWEMVRHHPNAEVYGLKHVAELKQIAARPKTFRADMALLYERASRICFEMSVERDGPQVLNS